MTVGRRVAKPPLHELKNINDFVQGIRQRHGGSPDYLKFVGARLNQAYLVHSLPSMGPSVPPPALVDNFVDSMLAAATRPGVDAAALRPFVEKAVQNVLKQHFVRGCVRYEAVRH